MKAQMEFELAYYDVTVQNVRHNIMGTTLIKKEIEKRRTQTNIPA